MQSLERLKSLAAEAPADFNDRFVELHHFSKSPPYRSRPSSFSEFVQYCESLKNGVQPGAENEQTIHRAIAYLKLQGTCMGMQEALAESWQRHPLVRR